MSRLKKLGFFLYTILIPIVFISIAHISKNMGMPLSLCQLVTQIFTILIMVPYFLRRKDYFKINTNLFKLFASIFLIEMIIYVIIAMGQGDFLLFGMHIINILKVLEVVIFAPIVEEMYFRGVLQDCSDTLSPKTTKLTPFLSAGLFGLGHVRYSGTIVIFLVTGLGYVSSLLLKRYKSLYASIFFHGIYNFTQVFIRIAKRG